MSITHECKDTDDNELRPMNSRQWTFYFLSFEIKAVNKMIHVSSWLHFVQGKFILKIGTNQ